MLAPAWFLTFGKVNPGPSQTDIFLGREGRASNHNPTFPWIRELAWPRKRGSHRKLARILLRKTQLVESQVSPDEDQPVSRPGSCKVRCGRHGNELLLTALQKNLYSFHHLFHRRRNESVNDSLLNPLGETFSRNPRDTFNNLPLNMRIRTMYSLFTGDLFLMDGRNKLYSIPGAGAEQVTCKPVCSSAGATGKSTMRSEIHSCGIAFTVSTICSDICGTTGFRTKQERTSFKGTHL